MEKTDERIKAICDLHIGAIREKQSSLIVGPTHGEARRIAAAAARKRRIIETTLRFANPPYQKRLSDFDFSCQPSVDPALIEELSTGRFLAEGRNILMFGTISRQRVTSSTP